jgi:hypothetical protein
MLFGFFGEFIVPILSTIILGRLFFEVKGISGTLKVIIYCQIIYIFLGGIVRPLVVSFLRPLPKYGDGLAEPNLIIIGEDGFNNVVARLNYYILFGVLIYYLSMKILVRGDNRPKIKNLEQSHHSVAVVYPALLIAILATYLESKGTSIRAIYWLSNIGLPAIGYGILMTDFRNYRKYNLYFHGTVLVGSTIVLSFLSTSKTPYLAGVLFLSMIIFERKNNFRNSLKTHMTKSRVRNSLYMLLLGFMILSSFTYLQRMKIGDQTFETVNNIGMQYFPFLPALYFIIVRFDLLRSISDSYSCGVNCWYGLDSYIQRAAQGLWWDYDSEARTFGQEWTQNIAGKLNLGSLRSKTSLSQSFIAEGHQLGGIYGVFLLSILYVTVTWIVYKFLTGNFFTKIIGLTVVSSGSLFESGFIANLETISQGVQVAIMSCFLILPLVNIEKVFNQKTIKNPYSIENLK